MRKFKISDYNAILIAIIILLFITLVVNIAGKNAIHTSALPQAVPASYQQGGGTNSSESKSSSAAPHIFDVLKKEFGDEYEIIKAAADRNGCTGDYLLTLFAIRKAENGAPGLEFGVMNAKAIDLDTQAGWAAATIMKNKARYKAENIKHMNFITYLGNKYCPIESDPIGNGYWKINVNHWVHTFMRRAVL